MRIRVGKSLELITSDEDTQLMKGVGWYYVKLPIVVDDDILIGPFLTVGACFTEAIRVHYGINAPVFYGEGDNELDDLMARAAKEAAERVLG